MKITPEECAELHRNNMGYIAAIYNRSIELLHSPNLASLMADSVQNQKAIAALPAILTLVAEQQQRIEGLETHVERLRGIVGYAIKDTYPTKDYVWAISDDCCDALEEIYRETPAQSLARIKREALQRAVEICEDVADTFHSSDCTYCANEIRKEMESLDDVPNSR